MQRFWFVASTKIINPLNSQWNNMLINFFFFKLIAANEAGNDEREVAVLYFMCIEKQPDFVKVLSSQICQQPKYRKIHHVKSVL